MTTVAAFAALEAPGVSRLAPISGGVNRLFRRGASDGVRIEIRNHIVFADLFLILKDGVNIRETGRAVQANVARSIQETIGMDVQEVNIHIEDIDYEGDETQA